MFFLRNTGLLIINKHKTHSDTKHNSCPSMCGRQRRLWWTSGETLLTTPHWPSTARLWRESAALNSWGCTSQRTSPGPPTPCQSPRRHNSAYTFSADWKVQVSLHPSSPPSTGDPLRVCWPAASLSGTGTVVQQTARRSSGQWTQLQKSSVPLSPPSLIFFLHDAPVKPIVSWRTPPILPTVSSSSYHQQDGTGSSEPLRQIAQQLFSPGCESPELNSHRTSLKPHTNPLTPETLYVCIHIAPWSCEARHFVPLYVHTCSEKTIKLNLTWLDLTLILKCIYYTWAAHSNKWR